MKRNRGQNDPFKKNEKHGVFASLLLSNYFELEDGQKFYEKKILGSPIKRGLSDLSSFYNVIGEENIGVRLFKLL